MHESSPPYPPIVLAVLGIALLCGILLFVQDTQRPRESLSSLSSLTLHTERPPAFAAAAPDVASSTEKVRIPILAYHIVRPSYPSDDRAVRDLAQTPEVFDAQMQYLADAGYHVISFGELENYLKSGKPLPKNPILITLDDGWSNQYTYAFPILKKYHYPATFFVFTNSIGTRGFLTWDNLRTLHNAGMTIGSHTRSHPFLTKVTNPAALWDEIDGSKQKIEKELGITVHEFAYPFGMYDPAIVELVKKAGYTSARGDYYAGGKQSVSLLYELNALNAPITTTLFAKMFPPR